MNAPGQLDHDDGAEEMARQLDLLRHRARRADTQLHRIRDELLDLIRRIDSHLAARGQP